MLSQFPAHIANARRAVETNYEFVKKIVSSAVGMFENSAVSHFVSLWKNVRVYYSVQHVNKGESQNTNNRMQTVKLEGFLAQLPCCPIELPRQLFVLKIGKSGGLPIGI